MLNSRIFGVHDQVFALHPKAFKNKNYYIKASLSTAKTAYSSNDICKLYGSRQWSGSSGTHWIFITVFLMKTLEESSKGFKIISPNEKVKWKKI